MKTITFECEVITPMFLSGADGRTPELRPPSIKGAMRFWWRAINGHLPLKNLKEKESEIFGTSNDEIGRSKFNICIKKQFSSKDIVNSLWEEIPYKERINNKKRTYKVPNKEYEGISYLLYSTHMLNERPYIKNGSSFSIKISSNNIQSFKEAVNSFAFLTFFGALGTRNRRGAGSFKVNDVIYKENDDYKNLFCTNKIKSKEELKDHIECKLKILISSKGNIHYSTLKNSKMYIFDSEGNWKDALKMISSCFLDFRTKNKKRIYDTPNFGFPIHHRNPKKMMGAGPESLKKNKKDDVVDFIEKRASPLIFKIIKTNESHYFPIIIWLNGELIPSNYGIMDKKGYNIKLPNKEIITEFLETIPIKSKLEVTL